MYHFENIKIIEVENLINFNININCLTKSLNRPISNNSLQNNSNVQTKLGSYKLSIIKYFNI